MNQLLKRSLLASIMTLVCFAVFAQKDITGNSKGCDRRTNDWSDCGC